MYQTCSNIRRYQISALWHMDSGNHHATQDATIDCALQAVIQDYPWRRLSPCFTVFEHWHCDGIDKTNQNNISHMARVALCNNFHTNSESPGVNWIELRNEKRARTLRTGDSSLAATNISVVVHAHVHIYTYTTVFCTSNTSVCGQRPVSRLVCSFAPKWAHLSISCILMHIIVLACQCISAFLNAAPSRVWHDSNRPNLNAMHPGVRTHRLLIQIRNQRKSVRIWANTMVFKVLKVDGELRRHWILVFQGRWSQTKSWGSSSQSESQSESKCVRLLCWQPTPTCPNPRLRPYKSIECKGVHQCNVDEHTTKNEQYDCNWLYMNVYVAVNVHVAMNEVGSCASFTDSFYIWFLFRSISYSRVFYFGAEVCFDNVLSTRRLHNTTAAKSKAPANSDRLQSHCTTPHQIAISKPLRKCFGVSP